MLFWDLQHKYASHLIPVSKPIHKPKTNQGNKNVNADYMKKIISYVICNIILHNKLYKLTK